MKKHLEDWHLDLRPVRRPSRHAPTESNGAVNQVPQAPAQPAPPAQPVQPAPASPELLALIDEVRRSVASLDTRLQAIEAALARAQRQATKARQKPAAPAPAAVPAPTVLPVPAPVAPNGAVKSARSDVRKQRANQLRKSPLPQALSEESA